MKKPITLLMSTLLVFTITGCSSNKKVDGTSLYKQSIKYENTSISFYRYTPNNFEFKGADTPLLIVLSDIALDSKDANSLLNKGFKDIADSEKANLVILEPNTTWSEKDLVKVQGVMANTTEVWLTGVDYSKGIDSKGIFYSSHFRKYIFSIGDANLFVKNNLDTDTADYDVTEWGSKVGGFGAGFSYLNSNFTKDDVISGFDSIKNQTRIYLDDGVSYLDEFSYFDKEMSVENKSFKASNGQNVEYTIYNKNESEEKVPLVVAFHGRGTHPNTYMQQTKWPNVAKDNNFEVMSITGPYDLFKSKDVNSTLTKITHETIMDYANNNNIDTNNIFLTGFSMGAYRTLALGANYTSYYKAIAPCDFVTAKKIEFKESIPAFILFGTNDFYNNIPSKNDWCGPMLSNLASVNGTSYTCDKQINNTWGYNFTNTKEIVPDNDKWTLKINTLNEKTIFAEVTNMSHNVLPEATNEIWEFFKDNM